MRSPIHRKCADTSYGQAGARVDPGQRPLVVEQQRLVAGVELDPVELLGVGAAGVHERQRPVDLAGELLVAPPGRAGGHEVLVPGVHLAQVGVAALGEGPAEVERDGRGVVGLQQPLGVGRAALGGEVEAVDHVAPVGGQLDAVAGLGRLGPRLGELPGHAADLDHRHAAGVGQHDGHLQQGLELVADGVGGGAGEGLGAVAALQHERLARGDGGEPVLELVALAREDERRAGASSAVTARSSAGSGQSGCWAAGRARQESRSMGSFCVLLTNNDTKPRHDPSPPSGRHRPLGGLCRPVNPLVRLPSSTNCLSLRSDRSVICRTRLWLSP